MTRSGKNLSLFPSGQGAADNSLPDQRSAAQARSGRTRVSQAPGKATAGRLWLAVCLHELIFEASAIVELQQPAVVVDIDDTTIAAANPAARQCGIEAGCALSAALAMADGLHIEAREVTREHQSLRSVAIWARTLTPTVRIVEPNVLLLEIRGSLRLFGGVGQITKAVNAQLHKRGLTALTSLAPGAQAAVWLSRHGGGEANEPAQLPGVLRSVPLSVTGWPQKLLGRLAEMGISRIGDLLRLPRDGLALRLGRQYMRELDQALGRAFEQPTATALPQEQTFSLDLPAETDDRAQLSAGCEQLFGRLVSELRRQQKQIARFTVRFFHLHREASSEVFELLMPACEQQHFLDLLTHRLESVVLPAPVIALELRTGELLDWHTDTRGLFSAAQQHETIGMIERLHERCGPKSVFGMRLARDHRPEYAWSVSKARRAESAHDVAGAQLSPWAGERPLWLLPQPRPCNPSDWQIERGPERIESGWWDDRSVNRDYYIASNKSHERFWVYFDHRRQDWYVHGVFG